MKTADNVKKRINKIGLYQTVLVEYLTSKGIVMNTSVLCNILNGKYVTAKADLVLSTLDEMLTKIENALK